MLPELESHPMVVVPGINDSGPGHWQTLWEAAHPDARRIEPESFDDPELEDWVSEIECAVAGCGAAPLLVAHSLGCLATLAWSAGGAATGRVAAIMLVAPPDPSEPAFPGTAPSFRGVLATETGAPTAVVASTNDPYAALDYPTSLAEGSGSALVVVGALEHINAESGLGEWPEGQRILADLVGHGGE